MRTFFCRSHHVNRMILEVTLKSFHFVKPKFDHTHQPTDHIFPVCDAPPPHTQNIKQSRAEKGRDTDSVHSGSLEENGRMTSVASQSMAAPGPPEAWDSGKCEWVKSIDGEILFLQPGCPPSKKRPPDKAASARTQNLGHAARLRVNMWHRSPTTCEDCLAARRLAHLWGSGRQRVHCRHLTAVCNWSFSRELWQTGRICVWPS